MTLKAESDLYDVYIETVPHHNGHFTSNFFDLKSGQKITTKFIPSDSNDDMRNVEVTVRTLNGLY